MDNPNPPRRSVKLGGKSKTILPDYTVNVWEGMNTYIKDLKQLSDGQSPDSLNWLTSKFKDHIELRRGYKLLGQARNTGGGRISGIGIGVKNDGTEIPFFTYGRKIKYYDSVADDTIEISTSDILPTVASGEDISIMPYQNITGSYVYFTSPNSSIYKIATANPSSAKDLLSTAFRGNARISQNRMAMWNRKDTYRQIYQNVLYEGVSDKTDISQYSQTTKESKGTGDGVTKTFTGTLAATSGKATAFYTEFAAPIALGVSITAISKETQAVVTVAAHTLNVGDAVLINGVIGMTEINNLIGIVMTTTPTDITLSINSTTFTDYSSGGSIYLSEYLLDDGNGNLSSIQGGVGTINYTTGAFSITFNTAPITGQNIYAQYYTEDSTAGGVADFTIDGTVSGKGKIFPQYDGGGAIVGVFPFDQVEYCFHTIKSWYLSLGIDDTKASNLPYRSNLGIPYLRAGYSTEDGIVFLDNSNPNQPKVQILEIDNNSATAIITVVPVSKSETLDLSIYGFSKAVMFRIGDYDILSFAGNLNGVPQTNNVLTFIRNIYTEQWDLTDYQASCFSKFQGTLLAGNSLSNNVFTLLSGFDDDGNLIQNHWNSKYYDFGIQGIKRFNRFTIRGLIQKSQSLDISVAFDSGNFVKIFSVSGTGSYVNLGNPVEVGSSTVGSNVIGGGGDIVTAYPFEIDFPFASDQFEYVQAQFMATNIGFIQIDEFSFKDCRYKGRRIPPSRTV